MTVASPYRPVLTHPVLRRVLPGVAVSALGDGMSVVAIAWLALVLSHSALLVAAAVAAYSLPGALGAAVLGRWMRRRGGAPLAFANAVVRAAALGLTAALAIAGLLDPFWYVCRRLVGAQRMGDGRQVHADRGFAPAR
jgi:DHA3 family macrolide efflux protein-like MFS transporter